MVAGRWTNKTREKVLTAKKEIKAGEEQRVGGCGKSGAVVALGVFS